MRKLAIFAAILMVAGCATANTNGSQQVAGTAANMPEPRTPDVFRKPPPQVGRWGSGFGYGGRY